MAEFVQIIRFKTDMDEDDLRARNEKYRAAIADRAAYTSAFVAHDFDTDEYVIVVTFPSMEAANRNNELPETQANAQEMAALATRPPSFSNLEVIDRMEPSGLAVAAS
jgi:hypothetical protein